MYVVRVCIQIHTKILNAFRGASLHRKIHIFNIYYFNIHINFFLRQYLFFQYFIQRENGMCSDLHMDINGFN